MDFFINYKQYKAVLCISDIILKVSQGEKFK